MPDHDEVVDARPHLRGRRLGEVVEAGERAELELDPLRAGAAERVAADHVAEEVDDVAADERPGRHQPERDDAQDDGDRPVGRVARSDDAARRSGSRARRS